MININTVGAEFLRKAIEGITDHLNIISPVEFNETTRYLPASVTPMPGYISFDSFPYMREILDSCSERSPVRELTLKKGVQVGYTTLLESIIFYYICQIKTKPCMMVSADKELVKARIENNILPMLSQSGKADVIRSSDEGNSRKTGKTANHLQWSGTGYLVPAGALNANKLRSYSIELMLKDEIDAWQDNVGRDGDPDALTSDRCSAYYSSRKIYRGSTPLIKGNSKVNFNYLKGDQRKYMVHCKHCNHRQELRWEVKNKETGLIGGFQWDYDDNGSLIHDSVRYVCPECGGAHYEYDKTTLFSPENGASWEPTAIPTDRTIRSYHLPAFYSPVGFQPWHKCVSIYLDGFDPIARKVTDINKYQTFYNNVLGEPFEIMGSKIKFTAVSSHRRSEYRLGEIPNNYAIEYSGSKILFLTCQVDVHKNNLAVSVMGWCKDSICYLIDYWRFTDDRDEPDCGDLTSPVWQQLRSLIDEKEYIADDGTSYRIAVTLVDSGYSNDTVINFCSEWDFGVIPIKGRDRPAKSQRILEFGKSKTAIGTPMYTITVDHYKDRLSSVLRREWVEESGYQNEYHFNAPVDTDDAQLKELTVETKREVTDKRGLVSYEWYRPGNAKNELWDLLVYGSAGVEILAEEICVGNEKMETVNWDWFWNYLETNELYFTNSNV